MSKIKRTLALLTTLLFCLTLCSCKELNEKRLHHALRQEDGTVLWNDAVYKLLPEYEDEAYDEYGLYDDPSGFVYVTDADVPVLLSDLLGLRMYLYKNGVIMMCWQEKGLFYCRADAYQQTVEDLNAVMEYKVAVGYSLSFTDPNTRQDVLLPLTDEQRQAVDVVLDAVDPIVADQNRVLCEAISLVTHNRYREALGEIAVLERMADDTYQLVTYESGGGELCYPVPEEYYPLFDLMMIPYWEAHGMTEDTFLTR